MSTKSNYFNNEISKSNTMFSSIRTTIETTFYRNNVIKIKDLSEAYELAKKSPGTILLDMPVFNPEEIGLQKDTKVLLFNDGAVVGRCAYARKIIGDKSVDTDNYSNLLREAVYNMRYKDLYWASAYIGLDKDFMVKAHLLVPKGFEALLYNWMLNFQYINKEYYEMYKNSRQYIQEGDIFIISDPDWKDDKHPYGLTLFDTNHNCAAILGMRYFGEHKKGTLTLAWSIANRNQYCACHGGLKKYKLENNKNFVVGIFGLSGSGKSTLTHAKHNNKYDISILHDDAFIISTSDGSSIAMEPSYFDKTQDYPVTSKDNKYLITVQNCGATINDKDECVLVTEDIRNGNGRAIKSKLWADNRVDKINEPINAIIWLMKDPTLPPVLKINNSELASTMGAVLATKRTTAERIVKTSENNALVIEPYANPFRTYPLVNDYMKFKQLFQKNVDCYIFNTGYFGDKKIPKDITIKILEDIVESKAEFKVWHPFEKIEYIEIDGFVPDMKNKEYINNLKNNFINRINYLDMKQIEKGGRDSLPELAVNSLKEIVENLQNLDSNKVSEMCSI